MKASKKTIETFLNGDDYTKKYITYVHASEFNNDVMYLQCPPNEPKKIYSSYNKNASKLKPFIWVKNEIYNQFKNELKTDCKRLKIKISKTISTFDGGYIERMEKGYNIMLSSEHASIKVMKEMLEEVGINEYITKNGQAVYYDEEGREIRHNKEDDTIELLDSNGNIDKILEAEDKGKLVQSRKRNDDYISLPAVEQYMMQHKIKLFKGFDMLDDVHILVMDIETKAQDKYINNDGAALYPEFGRIFQIGLRDNKGYRRILTTENEDGEQELEMIKEFYRVLMELKPNIMIYHNGEWFDIDYIEKRASMLGLSREEIQEYIKKSYEKDLGVILGKKTAYNRFNTTLKVGGNTETKTQTIIFGISCIDTIDAVKRASELDRYIPNNRLKDVVKYIGKEKKNRVYVQGDQIGNLFADKRPYYYNRVSGKYELATDDNKDLVTQGYDLVQGGREIEEQYLIDDLDETLELAYYYVEASFLLAKWLPINFHDTCKIGGASIWMKLLFSWSYAHNLTIPKKDKPRPYVGGLVAMLVSGFIKNGVKLDFASLYPSCFMEYVPTPTHDLTDFMKACLSYSMDTRNYYKKLKNDHKVKGEFALSKKYDALQHPLKIANNSFYGMLAFFGAYWSSIDHAEMVTCIGRQAERLLHDHFKEYPLKTIYCHTDAIHCEITDQSINDITYIGKGKNSLVEKDKEYKGLEAIVAEFNDKAMKGYMGLDIDEYFDSCINFAKSNYITREWNEKKQKNDYKSVGATAKTKTKSKYIGNWLDEQKDNLLNERGIDFKNSYIEIVKKILEGKMTNEEIASSARVKMTNEIYRKKYIFKRDKNGRLIKRMPYQELITKHKLKVNLGDRVKWVNIGKTTGDQDFGFIEDKIGYVQFSLDADNRNLKSHCLKLEEMFLKDKTKLLDSLTSHKDFVPQVSSEERYDYIKKIFTDKTIDEVKQLFLEEKYIIIKAKKKESYIDKILKPYIHENELMDSDDIIDLIKIKGTLTINPNINDCIYGDKSESNYSEEYVYLKATVEQTTKVKKITLKLKRPISNMKYISEKNIKETSKYNIEKYINKFNDALKPFLVVFKPEIRQLFNVTQLNQLSRFKRTKDSDYNLIKGVPYKDGVQTTEEIMMNPIKEERDFWRKMRKSPNYFIDNVSFNETKKYELVNGIPTESENGERWDILIDKMLPSFNLVSEIGFLYKNEYYELITPSHIIHYGYYKSFKIYDRSNPNKNDFEIVKLKKRKSSGIPAPNDIDRVTNTLLNYGYDEYLKRIDILKRKFNMLNKECVDIHAAYRQVEKVAVKNYGEGNEILMWEKIKNECEVI